MTETELVQEILGYIKTLYDAEYIGHIKVTKSNGIYSLELGIPTYMTRTNIILQTDSDTEFLNFVKEELRVRNYSRLMIYKVTRTNDLREE